MKRLLVFLVFFSLLVVGIIQSRSTDQSPDLTFPDEIPVEPEGYRMERYLSPVPQTLRGAKVTNTKEAKLLHDLGETVFVDVMPFTPKPEKLAKDTIWRPTKRFNIARSIWLANVGYGRLPNEMEDYFRSNLSTVTNNKKDKPLLFYCLKNCWMSWNAAKRALSYGYTDVYWYPAGTNGWQLGGGQLTQATPVTLPKLSKPKD